MKEEKTVVGWATTKGSPLATSANKRRCRKSSTLQSNGRPALQISLS